MKNIRIFMSLSLFLLSTNVCFAQEIYGSHKILQIEQTQPKEQKESTNKKENKQIITKSKALKKTISSKPTKNVRTISPLTSFEKPTKIKTTTNKDLTTDLVVEIKNIKNEKGRINIFLYPTKNGFHLDFEKAAKSFISAQKGAVAVKFTKVPKGKYAVFAFHDENNNKKLDKKLFIVSEPTAFSNNQKLKAKLLAPDFEDCAFEITGKVKTKRIILKL